MSNSAVRGRGSAVAGCLVPRVRVRVGVSSASSVSREGISCVSPHRLGLRRNSSVAFPPPVENYARVRRYCSCALAQLAVFTAPARSPNPLGVEKALKAYGMKEADIDKAADIAVSNPYANPRQVVREEIREVIRRAWAGEPARQDL